MFSSVDIRVALALSICCWMSHPVMAQSSGVVAAMDTRKPLRDVSIRLNDSCSVTTDWRGHYKIARAYAGATLVCKGYMVCRLTAKEMQRDTVFLIPLEVTLAGVEIKAPKSDIAGAKYISKEELKMVASGKPSLATFDFFALFDRRQRHVSKKERLRQKRILDNY